MAQPSPVIDEGHLAHDGRHLPHGVNSAPARVGLFNLGQAVRGLHTLTRRTRWW
jgi:hypothetical protein